jgi:hypothetical protein
VEPIYLLIVGVEEEELSWSFILILGGGAVVVVKCGGVKCWERSSV